jgi:hypothetical protein
MKKYLVDFGSFFDDGQSLIRFSSTNQPPDRLWSQPDVQKEKDAWSGVSSL